MNDPEPADDGRRYELVFEEDEGGVERLTIARLSDIARTTSDEIPRLELIRLACRIYDTRRARGRYFHNSLFGEPVWDMLLALFCLPSRSERLSVSGLCHAAHVPPTTGLRWAQLLQQKGLIERHPDPMDKRRIYLTLTEEGERLMSAYLASIYHKFTSG